MTAATPHVDLRHNRLQAPPLKQLLLAWGLFFTLSTFYCYGYALVVEGNFSTRFGNALQCASRDWLIWALVSPTLLYQSLKSPLHSRAGATRLISFWLTAILITGSIRVMAELLWGSASPLQVLWIYLPRYGFFASFVLLAGLAYSYWRLSARPMWNQEKDLREDNRLIQEANQSCGTNPPRTLLVSKGQAKILLPVNAILCVTAAGNYLEIHTSDNHYLMRSTLKAIVETLASENFVRVHRSHLVKISAINSVIPKTMKLTLNNKLTLPIGQSYLPNLAVYFSKP